MKNVEFKKEFILSCCDKVKQICSVLFAHTGITFYNFVRLYNDGRRITLYSDPAWGRFFLNEYKRYGLIFESDSVLKNKYILWDISENIVNSKLIRIAREAYNIDHGFTMIDRTKEYIDFHYFASTRINNDINNYYINNLSYLQAFSLYFLDKSDFLRKDVLQNRVILHTSPNDMPGIEYFNEDLTKNNFPFDISQFYLKGNYENVNLTAREAECLALKFQGKSFKELAFILNISPRTAETHVNRIKVKLKCDSLQEVSKILISSGLKDILDLISN